jgi:hypothetical protein
VADLRQVIFSQTGQFHDSITVNTVLQHGTGNFQFAFIATFLPGWISSHNSGLVISGYCHGLMFKKNSEPGLLRQTGQRSH